MNNNSNEVVTIKKKFKRIHVIYLKNMV